MGLSPSRRVQDPANRAKQSFRPSAGRLEFLAYNGRGTKCPNRDRPAARAGRTSGGARRLRRGARQPASWPRLHAGRSLGLKLRWWRPRSCATLPDRSSSSGRISTTSTTFAATWPCSATLSPRPFPAWEGDQGETVVYDEIYGERLRLLKMLGSAEPPRLVVTSIQSLLQPVPSREKLAQQTRRLRRGETLDLQELLALAGLPTASTAPAPWSCRASSRRGAALSISSRPTGTTRCGSNCLATRSIRSAASRWPRSAAWRRSTRSTSRCWPPATDDREHFAGYLPEGSWFYLVEPADVEEEGRRYLERLDRPQDFHGVASTLRQITRFPSVTAASVPAGSLETTCHLGIESVERFSGDIAKVRDELDASMGAGHAGEQDVFVVCQTEAEAERLQEIFAATRLAAAGRLHYPMGRLKAGFRLVSERVALVSGSELFHRADLNRPARRAAGPRDRQLPRAARRRLRRPSVARHRALSRVCNCWKRHTRPKSTWSSSSTATRKCTCPPRRSSWCKSTLAAARRRGPRLAHVGGRMWTKQKEAARAAVTDLAADMLELQAARALRPASAFPATRPGSASSTPRFPIWKRPTN